MPRPRKFICNKAVLFVTTSLEEGLLLPPNPLINLILESALARAQTLHPVKVCHHLFEPNHGHMILAVDNPDDVPGFMERFKTESAHAINRLLGRTKRTIWCEGYDSPPLLTPSSVVSKIVYIYSNPSKDGLEKSIDTYPGLSSWDAFSDNNLSITTTPRIRRPMVPSLATNPEMDFERKAQRLKKIAKSNQTFKITTDAWMDCFKITDENERKAYNHEIKEKVKLAEDEYNAERQSKGIPVIGRNKLISAAMDLYYRSKKRGRRMLCISDDPKLRRRTIEDIRAREEEARAVLKKWKVGDFTHPFPLGLFPPSMPKVCESYSPNGFASGEI